jgi:predicted branched-subunit amino acid permease
MSIGRPTAAETRLGFWATGLSVFAFWNAATLVGALAGSALSDPRAFGLDAVAPAAFLALLAPRLREAEPRAVAAAAALAALGATPFAPAGVPVLVAAAVAASAALARAGAGSGAARVGEARAAEA